MRHAKIDGTITAGSASQISDGACAVVVMSKAKAQELGVKWLAEIGAHGMVAGPDSTLQMQPANATAKACTKEGISPADLPRIFDRLWRADVQDTGVSRGAGLGLAIVKELAERHGGTATASSVKGRGSTFRIRLPAPPPAVQAEGWPAT